MQIEADPPLPAFEGRAAVLLGAGASADAGIPMTGGLTRAAMDELTGKYQDRSILRAETQLSRALLLVYGTLVAHDSARGAPWGSPTDDVDIERLIAATRLLAERLELEVSPFVGAWLPAVDTVERPYYMGSLGKMIANLVPTSRGTFQPRFDERQFDNQFKSAVLSLVGQGDGQLFKQLAARLLGLLPRLVAIPDETKVDYLAPLLNSPSPIRPVSIATLNYDLCVEVAGQRCGVKIDTGVSSWMTTGKISFPDDRVPLYKLHGSIDWSRSPGSFPALQETLSFDGQGEPWIVLGSREKLQASGPFLDLLSTWRASLLDIDHLIVIGYSFRDDHINDAIGGWLERDDSRVITVVDPSWPEWESRTDFRTPLTRRLTPNRIPGLPQVPLRINVVREPANVAIPQIFGPAATP
jgi:hypothetical protein